MSRPPDPDAPTLRRLLVATTNPGKLSEVAAVLAGLPLLLETLADLPSIAPPSEDGRTFAENARIKARAYARAAGRLTVAEDSGLEIDPLDGRPGVHSARYPGDTYEEKFRGIYAELAGCGPEPHAARFVCALALVDPARILFETTAAVEGRIAPVPKGRGGFGYDPILYYPPYDRTLAEVSFGEKLAVSHRGQAFRALRAFLEREMTILKGRTTESL